MEVQANNNSSSFWDSKFLLAMIVLGVSILGVTVLAGIVLFRDSELSTAQYVLGAILPLLGTWVGTILAYYFSRENFESANRSVREMAKQLTPSEKLESIPVRQKMIPKEKMILLKITDVKPIEKLSIVDDILKTLKEKKRNRLPILDENDYPQYMIHRSMIDKYLAQLSIEKGMPADKIKQKTLIDLINQDNELKKMFETSWVTISETKNLADAKNKMDQVEDCLDIFVTKNGLKNEPVLGWLTNLIITESAKV